MTDPAPLTEEPEAARGWFDRLIAWGRPYARPLHWIWMALILGYVGWKLTELGWRDVLTRLPVSPWFYIVYAVSFMLLPLTEQRIFRMIWGKPVPLGPVLRKRALNAVVIGYSGDAWFFVWASATLGIPTRRAIAGLKDSSILSGMGATLTTLLLVAALIGLGQQGLVDRIIGGQTALFVGLAVAALAVAVLAVLFRRAVFWIDGARAIRIFVIHLARAWAVLALQVVQWWVVLPMVPMETWLLFVTAQAVINQLPFVPNREILYLAVSLELVGGSGVDAATLSALMVATALVKQLANLFTLAITGFGGNDGVMVREHTGQEADRPT